MNKIIIFDASAFSWTGSSTYISDFISHLGSRLDTTFFIIAPQRCVSSFLHVSSPNIRFFSLDSFFLSRIFGKFIAKHLLLFYVSCLAWSKRTDFAILINSTFIVIPFVSRSTRVWHNSLHLADIPSTLLMQSPIRFFRLYFESLLDRLYYHITFSHVFPSLYCRNLVYQRYGINLSSVLIPHSLGYLHELNLRAKSLPYHKSDRLRYSTINIVYVAAVESYKNHSIALDAFRLLRGHSLYHRLRFYFVGPLVHRASVDAIRSSDEFRQSKLILCGRIPFSEIVSILESCHISLALSSTETFGYPVPESFAFGIPLIAYDQQCNKELAGHSALYIRSSSELADAILAIALSPDSYLDWSHNAFERFDYLKEYCGKYVDKILRATCCND